MLAFLGGLVGGIWSALANFVAGLLKTREDEAFGQAQQKVVDQQAQMGTANENVQTVTKTQKAAADSMAASAADPGGLRQPDPDSRD